MVNTILTSGTGLATTQIIDTIPTPTPTSEIVKIAVQLIIGIFTILGLIKQRKNLNQ